MTATAEIRALHHSNYSHIQVRFDPEYGVCWAYMNANPRPCFSVQLLSELRSYLDGIVASHGGHKPEKARVRYGVLACKTAGSLNFGGDLALVLSLSAHQDCNCL